MLMCNEEQSVMLQGINISRRHFSQPGKLRFVLNECFRSDKASIYLFIYLFAHYEDIIFRRGALLESGGKEVFYLSRILNWE